MRGFEVESKSMVMFFIGLILNIDNVESFNLISQHKNRVSSPAFMASRTHIDNVLRRDLRKRVLPILMAKTEDDEDDFVEEDPMKEWKELYPDLEFVDYSDPEYRADQGIADDDLEITKSSTEEDLEKIEEMRESRRKRNDEFQYETYFQKHGSQKYHGEWTVYKVMYGDESEMPGLAQAKHILKVISSAKKVIDNPDAPNRLDGEYIEHSLELSSDDESNDYKTFGTSILEQCQTSPSKLRASEFRGPQGIMCVGATYTLCKGEDNGVLKTEIGIHSDNLRFVVKLIYGEEKSLQTMIVCRERSSDGSLENNWPVSDVYDENTDVALYGPAGAENGLYDPPPVGTPENYLSLDMQGGASLLIPFKLSATDDNSSYVTSLDWSPGRMRYQVDRKTLSDGMSLKTLELCEVEKASSEKYRPTDGGENMRQ